MSIMHQRFAFIYGEERAAECARRLENLISEYSFKLENKRGQRRSWTEKDTMLITYGDSILKEGWEERKLEVLEGFLNEYLEDTITALHILPFFPFSSDGGFAVIDYKQVREDLGSWDDIERLAQSYDIMADLVINHISTESRWFENFKKREEPGRDYFLDLDPDTDLSKVTRPRSSPLLTKVETEQGSRFVWTTFSEDQADLDFSNPDVLFEYLDIFLFYLSKGIRIIRLDAIAYLWKKVGSNSIHLPETHEIVKLFRDIVDYLQPSVRLVTETNVPFEENISYFGNGDEAHMIYQFSLPPLLLHAILMENSSYLTAWASDLPDSPSGATYLNFTSSHDGIGVRPLEGLIPDEEFKHLVEGTKERGGYISYKTNPDGTESPYELNITYFDAFSDPEHNDMELQFKRYICSQVIMMSLRGLPAFYLHNLTGTRNDIEGVIQSQQKRDINRKQWDYEELVSHLEDENHITGRVLSQLKELLHIRKEQPAFSPEAAQKVITDREDLFILLRTSEDEGERILVVSNVTGEERELGGDDIRSYTTGQNEAKLGIDLITGRSYEEDASLKLNPFQTVWLKC